MFGAATNRKITVVSETYTVDFYQTVIIHGAITETYFQRSGPFYLTALLAKNLKCNHFTQQVSPCYSNIVLVTPLCLIGSKIYFKCGLFHNTTAMIQYSCERW